jgi:hypothetical protein
MISPAPRLYHHFKNDGIYEINFASKDQEEVWLLSFKYYRDLGPCLQAAESFSAGNLLLLLPFCLALILLCAPFLTVTFTAPSSYCSISP